MGTDGQTDYMKTQSPQPRLLQTQWHKNCDAQEERILVPTALMERVHFVPNNFTVLT